MKKIITGDSSTNYQKNGYNIRENLIRYSDLSAPQTIDILSITLSAYLLVNHPNQNVVDIIRKKISSSILSYHLEITASKYHDIIKKISEKYSAIELKEVILFYNNFDRKGEDSQHGTPRSISKLAIHLLELEKEDHLVDLGSGHLSFIIETLRQKNLKKITGYETNIQNIIVAEIKNHILDNKVDIIQGNIFELENKSKYTKIFCDPPLGLRFDKNHSKELINKIPQSVKTMASLFWMYALVSIDMLDENGKAVLVTTGEPLYTSQDRDIREYFIENGYIETIISLTNNLLDYSGVKLYMVVLGKGNKSIKMVNAENIFTSHRSSNYLTGKNIEDIIKITDKNSALSMNTEIDELRKYRYQLTPRRYLTRLDPENSIKMGEVILSIDRGLNISRQDLEAFEAEKKTNKRYVNLSDVQDGKILNTCVYLKDSVEEISDKFARAKTLKQGDLLISRTGSPIKFTVVEGIDETMYFSSNLYSVRLDTNRINPYFIKAFLQSDLGTDLIEAISQGTAIPMISIRNLKDLEIPYLPLEKQNEFLESYMTYSKLIEQKKNEIIDLEAKKILEINSFFEEVRR